MTVTRQITKRCASCAQRRRRLMEAGNAERTFETVIDRTIHWRGPLGGPLCGL